MPTYVELMAQIEALQEQAEEVRHAEIAGVIAEMKQQIQDYGLTAADLGFASIAPLKRETAVEAGRSRDEFLIDAG